MVTKTKKDFRSLLSDLGRNLYVDKSVSDLVEICEPQDIEFFTLRKRVTPSELEAEAEKLGLELAHPYALALYAKDHPEFADGKITATQWKDKDGQHCYATFDVWSGGRDVDVCRRSGDWNDEWRFAGSRKAGTLPSTLPTTKLEKDLTSILFQYCGERGDNEGAVETLERIIQERNILLKNAIKTEIFHLK